MGPAQLRISIVSLSYFYFSTIHTLSLVTGTDLQSPAALAERRAHVVGTIMDHLRPIRSKVGRAEGSG